MAEGQRWVGGAQGRDAHRLEAGVVVVVAYFLGADAPTRRSGPA